MTEHLKIVVGLLALQGDFAAHGRVVTSLGATSLEVRTPDELKSCSHLIIPGGETTSFLKLLDFHNLREPLFDYVKSGKPILATCAGIILIAGEVANPQQESLGLINIKIERNSYGRQVDSFEADLEIPILGNDPFNGIFIRAPGIISIGKNVESMSSFDGDPVLVREGNILGATFHPELGEDARLHEYFLGIKK